MSYDRYEELWQEAKQKAEECENCKAKELTDRAKEYSFCETHDQTFFAKYLEKRWKGLEMKDEFTYEDIVEGLSEQLGGDVTIGTGEIEASEPEEKVREIKDRLSETLNPRYISQLADVLEENPGLAEDVKSEIRDYSYGIKQQRLVDPELIQDLAEIKALVHIHTDKDVLKKSTITRGAIRSKLDSELFHQVALREPEELESMYRPNILVTLINLIKEQKVKQPYTDKLAISLTVNSYDVEAREHWVMRSKLAGLKEVARENPELVAERAKEIFYVPENIGFKLEKYPYTYYEFFQLMAYLSEEVPEKIEEHKEQLQKALDIKSENIHGHEQRLLPAAASAALLRTGLNDRPEEELLENIRHLTKASSYHKASRGALLDSFKAIEGKETEETTRYIRDGINLLALLNDSEKKEQINKLKTPETPRPLKESIENFNNAVSN